MLAAVIVRPPLACEVPVDVAQPLADGDRTRIVAMLDARDLRRRRPPLGVQAGEPPTAYGHVVPPDPRAYSLLSAHAIPPHGAAPTEFADMRAAYDAWPPAMKAGVDPLVAVHDCDHSLVLGGGPKPTPKERRQRPPAAGRARRRTSVRTAERRSGRGRDRRRLGRSAPPTSSPWS